MYGTEIMQVIIGSVFMRGIDYIIVCPMLCNAWTEYKFTCMCICLCVRHTFCQLAYRSDPLNGFLQLIA